MSLIAFINKKTFEVQDELDEYIYCDYEIRNVIANLNKKGYKTSYSCAGHNEVGILWNLHKEEINKLEEYLEKAKSDEALHFISKDEEYFYHKDEKVATNIYISFSDNYDFKIKPSGFTYELFDNKSYLSKRIDFYEDQNHTIRKTDKVIYDELEQAQNELLEWSNNLPIIANK